MGDLRYGSGNYRTRVSQGWVEGSARYADEEPHHGPYAAYVTMHDPARERLFCLILDGRYECSRPTAEVEECDDDTGDRDDRVCDEGEVEEYDDAALEIRDCWVREVFPRLTDDAEADRSAAVDSGTIRTYLVRNRSGDCQEVALEPGDYEWAPAFREPEVEQDETDWRYEYYDATLERSVWTSRS